MVDPTGTTGYTYDTLDRLTRTTYPDTKTVQFTYDRAGNRTSLTNPGAISTSSEYDGANRLTRMTQGVLIWTFGYDGAGNRTSLTHPNGTSIAYAYFNNNWLQTITHRSPGGATLESLTYSYDVNGNRLSQADGSGTTTFLYDGLNRLTQAAYPGTFGTWGWAYDGVGNRTQQTAPPGAVLPGVGAVPPLTTYTYDANNRLTQAGSTTYSYDANGNLTGTSAGAAYTWDVWNRLSQVVTPAAGSVTYTYNGDGVKVRRVAPDGTRNYYHDGFRSIWETDGAGGLLQQYDRDIFGNMLSRRDNAGVRRYYHHDGLGSPVVQTDGNGAVVGQLYFDAWGNLRTSPPPGLGRYGFTGAELDVTTLHYHMGARFYEPTLGRWLSEDPVQDRQFEPASLNFYNYASNNPVLFIDPTGTVEGEGGGAPPKSAEERLQDFINAMLEIEETIRNALNRGSLRSFLDSIRRSLEKFKDFETIYAMYNEGYKNMALGLVYLSGSVALFIAANQTPQVPMSLVVLAMSGVMGVIGVRLELRGLGQFALAVYLDQTFHQGRVFREWIRQF